MASYKGHLTFSTGLGAAYGAAGFYAFQITDWGAVAMASGLTAAGGLLPDLDSDSGVPVREMFGLAAAIAPLLLYHRLSEDHRFTPEQVIAVLAGVYLFIRYGLANIFRRITVHRGMYHSIPAMFIAGLIVWLCYSKANPDLRLYLAGGVMLGFLSHLVLDELCSVDFNGVQVRLNHYAGSALKFFSPSWGASLTAYLLLGALVYLAYLDRRDLDLAPLQKLVAALKERYMASGGR